MSRTVLLCRVDGNFGGVERFILSLLPALDEQRYRPVVVSIANDAELAQQTRDAGFVSEFIPMKSRLLIPSAARHLLAIATKHQADAIHTFGFRSNSLAYYIKKDLNIPWIIRLPNYNWTDYKNPVIGWYSHRLNNYLIRKADAVQVISSQLQAFIQQWEHPPEKIYHIPNSLNLENYKRTRIQENIRKNLNIPEFAPVIGSVGRLDPIKGFDILIKAYQSLLPEVPEARLMIVGHGKELKHLKKLEHKLNLPHPILFPGFQANPIPYLIAMDVFVCSSHSEGVPYALLEAMALKLPVVSTHVGAIDSVLHHNKNGLLVKPNHFNDLSDQILKVLKHKQLANRLGQSAYDTIKNHFSVQYMAKSVQDMYDEMIQRKLVALKKIKQKKSLV